MKNKFLYVFFAVTALLLCFAFSASASSGLSKEDILKLDEVENSYECYAVGDVDSNGAIDSADARFILRASVQLEKVDTYPFAKADVDGDGIITAADARLALRLAVGLDKAPEHTVQEIVITPATCSEDGLTIKFCTSCMKIYAKIETPAKEDKHIAGFWETVKKPDCSNKGLAQRPCLVCGKIIAETELSATNKHSGEWTYPEGKDCYNPVPKNRTCTVCGTHEEAVENPQGGHSYKWYVTKENTCTEDGVQVYRCSNCDLVNKEAPIPAIGHGFIYNTEIKTPTCTETGLKGAKCVNCDFTKDEEIIPALEHNYDNKHYKVTKEPTCAKEGSADAVCSRCGDAKTLVLSKIPHTLTDKWTTTLKSTCTDEGEKIGTCRYCGPVTEKIPAKGHTVDKWTTVKKASCTEPGLMQGECKVCSDKSATKEIAQLPHDFNKNVIYWTSGVACKEMAKGYYKCNTCDARDNIEFTTSCTNRNFKNTKVVTKATCTTKQTTIDICDYCEEEIEGTLKSEGKPLGHEYKTENWKVTKAAACTTDGLKECKCTRCDEVSTKSIPALGHEYRTIDWKVTKDATCTDAGLKECKCTRCDETASETIKATGHTRGEWAVTSAPSCSKTGTETLACSVCTEILETREVEKTAHTPEYTVIENSAEIDADGNFIIKCQTVCAVCSEQLEEAEEVVRIAVSCMDESIKVVLNETSNISSGGTVYFTVEGATGTLFVMVDYADGESDMLENISGSFSFKIPDSLSETETITIIVSQY